MRIQTNATAADTADELAHEIARRVADGSFRESGASRLIEGVLLALQAQGTSAAKTPEFPRDVEFRSRDGDAICAVACPEMPAGRLEMVDAASGRLIARLEGL